MKSLVKARVNESLWKFVSKWHRLKIFKLYFLSFTTMFWSMMMNSCCLTSFIRLLTQIFHSTYTLHLTLTNLMNPNSWRDLDLENGILWLYEMFFKFLSSSNASKGLFVTVWRVCVFFWGNMIQRFAKPAPVLCMVAKKLFDHIHDHHGHSVTEWNQDILAPIKLQTFVDAILVSLMGDKTCGSQPAVGI